MTERLSVDYPEARRRFLEAATAAGAAPVSHPHPEVRGPDGGEVAIDVARVGPDDAPAVLVVVSGTHGVEGFAGSALQARWLAGGPAELPLGLAVVLVHALNPYGFAWTRRTNEDNVDLNRNFIDWAGSLPDNSDYGELADRLVPERWDRASQESSTAALLVEIETRGLDQLQQAISGGQYRHPRGVFYGGEGPVWSHRWLRANAADLVGPATRVGVVDLHTGLGPWGHGELIVTGPADDPASRRAERWWGDVRSMRDGESVSAELSGDWLGILGELWPDAEVTAAALEFGTVDPVSVLQALRSEAWLHAETRRLGREPAGDPASGEPSGAAVRHQVREAFADDDPAWLGALGPRFDDVITAAIGQLAG